MSESLISTSFSDLAVDALCALALGNYGHFTSMQVRDGAVQGLDLHLARLRDATRELFDNELDLALLRQRMRDASAAFGGDASLRVTVFAPQFDFRHPERACAPQALVTLAVPFDAPAAPVRVKSYLFGRNPAHIKHVGTFPLFHYRRQARLGGFDDALFVDSEGRISEGTVWNLGFREGRTVIWPEAPALRGVTRQLLEAGLAMADIPQVRRPVHMADLASFSGAFACNAGGVWPLAAIDGVVFAESDGFSALMAGILQGRPWQEI